MVKGSVCSSSPTIKQMNNLSTHENNPASTRDFVNQTAVKAGETYNQVCVVRYTCEVIDRNLRDSWESRALVFHFYCDVKIVLLGDERGTKG